MVNRIRIQLKNTCMTGNNHNQAGLTLVETLIATAVIAIVMVLVTNVILLFLKTESETGDQLLLEGVSRQVISQIVEYTREGYVDYEYYGAPPVALNQDQLAVRDLNGNQTVFWFFTDASTERHLYVCHAEYSSASCPSIGDPSVNPQWERVDPNSVDFMSASFYLRPDTAPYIGPGPTYSDTAPIVTISMQLSGDDGATTPLIQTSVTTRIYAR